MTTTTRPLPTSKKSDRRWLVLVDGKEVGTIEKAGNNKSTLNPYKAFKGIGFEAQIAGFFYDQKEALKWGYDPNRCLDSESMVFGGFEAALAKVAS